jgi:hypothetical protein
VLWLKTVGATSIRRNGFAYMLGSMQCFTDRVFARYQHGWAVAMLWLLIDALQVKQPGLLQ